MPVSVDEVDRFLDRFADWAHTQPDVMAVALVGSHARNTATETSDVDLVVITRQPDRYLRNQGWIRRFGPIDQQRIEDYGKVTSIRVWYTDGREVEYGITGESWAALPLDEDTRRVLSDGMRVLFERGPILSRHQLDLPDQGVLPTRFRPRLASRLSVTRRQTPVVDAPDGEGS